MNTPTTFRTKAVFAFLLLTSFLTFKASAQTGVTWCNLNGVSQSVDTIKRNTSSSVLCAASSVNWLQRDSSGWVEFYRNKISSGSFIVGFSKIGIDQSQSSEAYGAYFDGTNIQIYESGMWLGSFGSFGSGDTLRVSRIGNTMYYLKNGISLRSVSCDSTESLLITVSFEYINNFVSDVNTSLPTPLRADNSVTDVLPPTTNNGSISVTPRGGTSPYTYNWSNSATTSSISSLTVGTYTVTITDNASNTLIENLVVGYQVIWQDTSNVTYTGNNISNNSNTVNSGAESENYLAAGQNGYVQLVATGDAWNFDFGISTQGLDYKNLSAYEFSFHKSLGTLYVDISGFRQSTSWSVNSGDTLKIQRSGDTILFYKNSTQLVLVTPTRTGKMGIDFSTSVGNTASLNFIKTNFGLPYGLTPAVTDVALSSYNSGAINLTVLGGTSPYTYAWSDGPTTQNRSSLAAGPYTVTVTDNTSATTSATVTVGYQATWEDTVRAKVTGNSIASTNSSGQSGGRTLNYIPAGQDGYIQYIITEINPMAYVFGLSTPGVDYNIAWEEYGFYNNGASTTLREGGVVPTGTSTYSIAIGDTLKIARASDTIKYYQNSTLLRSVAALQNGRLSLDVSAGTGSLILLNFIKTNIGSSFGSRGIITDQIPAQPNTGSITLTIVGGASPFTYVWSNGATTQNLSSLNAGTYSVTVTDANSNVTTNSIIVGYQIEWQNVVNGTTSSNGITSTINAWTGGAASKNFLMPYENGYVSQVITDIVSTQYEFGASEKDSTISRRHHPIQLLQRPCFAVYLRIQFAEGIWYCTACRGYPHYIPLWRQHKILAEQHLAAGGIDQ